MTIEQQKKAAKFLEALVKEFISWGRRGPQGDVVFHNGKIHAGFSGPFQIDDRFPFPGGGCANIPVQVDRTPFPGGCPRIYLIDVREIGGSTLLIETCESLGLHIKHIQGFSGCVGSPGSGEKYCDDMHILADSELLINKLANLSDELSKKSLREALRDQGIKLPVSGDAHEAKSSAKVTIEQQKKATKFLEALVREFLEREFLDAPQPPLILYNGKIPQGSHGWKPIQRDDRTPFPAGCPRIYLIDVREIRDTTSLIATCKSLGLNCIQGSQLADLYYGSSMHILADREELIYKLASLSDELSKKPTLVVPPATLTTAVSASGLTVNALPPAALMGSPPPTDSDTESKAKPSDSSAMSVERTGDVRLKAIEPIKDVSEVVSTFTNTI